ncbi:MAG: energy transducer TonB [Acidobacteriota bacterium]
MLLFIAMGTHLAGLPSPGGDSSETPGLGSALHLIFFEDYPYTVELKSEPGSFQVTELPSAEFPQQFSCRYAPFRKLQRFMLPDGFEIPRKVILLSIHTLSEQSFRNKNASYQSPFTDFSYQLKATDWGEDSYQLALKGEYKGFKFSNIPLKVHNDRATLATIRKTSRQTLYAVLTPTQAIPLFLETETPEFESNDFQPPRLLEGPQPRLPKGISAHGTVILRGMITSEGKLDPDRFVLLECPHPLLGESALETIIDDWQFQPAVRNGIPVEGLTTIEVQFVPE